MREGGSMAKNGQATSPGGKGGEEAPAPKKRRRWRRVLLIVLSLSVRAMAWPKRWQTASDY